MTILGSASELDLFTIGSGSIVEVTTAGKFDANFCRAAIQMGNVSTNYFERVLAASQTTFWLSFDWIQLSTAALSTDSVVLVNSSGTPVFKLTFTSAMVLQAQYWNGSSWTNIGSTLSLTSSVLTRLVLKLVCGGSGSFELYKDGSLALSGSASMTSVTNVLSFRCYCTNNNGTAGNRTHFSQLIWGTTSLVGINAELEAPTAGGTDNSAGTGSYVDIDEAVLSDADLMALPNNTDQRSFTSPARTQTTGAVQAVVVNARVKKDASGPSQFRFYLLIGGTRYYGATQAATTGFAGYQEVWTQNPATSAPWTLSAANDAAMEWGIEALT